MTAATVRTAEGCRFYTRQGEMVFEIPKKSGKGMKRPNITDAREMDLVPSVTTIIRTMNKPQLEAWLREQACLAVLTTPRKEGEALDSFVHRVLHVEKVQEEESAMAADKGSLIHEAISLALQNKKCDPKLMPYVEAALPVVHALGKVAWTEKVLVGEGYAGRADVACETDRHIAILDFKTTKKVPSEAYKEHRMQVAAYAKANGNTADKHVVAGLLYISTIDPGVINLCLQDNWERDYEQGFNPLLKLWQYLNDFNQ